MRVSAHHNNARLRAFLDRFGFRYEFYSSTAILQSGPLRRGAAARPGELRQGEASHAADPGRGAAADLFAVPAAVARAPARCCSAQSWRGTRKPAPITYIEEDGSAPNVPVTGGHCKLQWKPDWAMRWVALGVDYEMYGKDLIPSRRAVDQICKSPAARRPRQYMYELFLDEQGQKISKSKGNGHRLDEWLAYGAGGEPGAVHVPEAAHRQAALFRRDPQGGGRIHRLPRAISRRRNDATSSGWKIRSGTSMPASRRRKSYPVSFALLLNLVSASNAHNRDVLWGFIRAYAPGSRAGDQSGARPAGDLCAALLRGLRAARRRNIARPPTRSAPRCQRSPTRSRTWATSATREMVQNVVYEIGKAHGFEPLRDWFKALYEVLLGQTQGPRFRLLRGAVRLRRDRGLDPHRAVGRVHLALRVVSRYCSAAARLLLCSFIEPGQAEPKNTGACDVREGRLSRRREGGRTPKEAVKPRARGTRNARRCHVARAALHGVPETEWKILRVGRSPPIPTIWKAISSSPPRSAIRPASSVCFAPVNRFPEQAKDEIETALKLRRASLGRCPQPAASTSKSFA